ncbi:MAG: permease-like cell division protein FtsX, partial [Oscillospiraceae bacterium]
MEVEDEEAFDNQVQLLAIPNVAHAQFVSKKDAFVEVEGLLDDYGDGLLDGVDYIFPAKYNVTVDDINFMDETNEQIKALGWVERTYMSSDLTGIMITISNAVTYGGWGLVAILALVSVIVISNTIRLTVFARRREISIMKYVGATNAFIRLPFFVEGMTVGIIAGLLATGVLCGAYYLVYQFVREMYNVWVMSLMSSLFRLEDIWYYIGGGAVALGILLGGLGTAFSVRKHLKV